MICPLLSVGNTSILGISTAQDDANYYSELTELKYEDSNELVFHSIKISTVCDACRLADKARTCTHLRHKQPPWKTSAAEAKVKAIMRNDPVAYAREHLGLIKGAGDYVFDRESVNKLLERDRYDLPNRIPIIYVAIDPAGGGTKSNFAFIALANINGNYVVRFFFLFLFIYKVVNRVAM